MLARVLGPPAHPSKLGSSTLSSELRRTVAIERTFAIQRELTGRIQAVVHKLAKGDINPAEHTTTASVHTTTASMHTAVQVAGAQK